MLKSLKITGFKSIYNETLHFGKINLFVGPNGAGKSNALEAIAVLSAALSRGLDPISLDAKGVRLSLPHLFKSAFRNTDLKPHFRFEAEFEHGRYECSIRSNAKRSVLEFHSEALYQGEEKVYGRGPNGIKINSRFVEIASKSFSEIEGFRSVWDVIRLFANISEQLRLELEQIADFRIYAPQTAIMRGMAIDNRPVEPLGLTGSGLASAFNDFLSTIDDLDPSERNNRKAIMSLIWKPGWANQIKIGGFDPSIVPSHVVSEGLQLYIRDKYMKTNRNFLSTFDASEGTLYLIFVTTLLLHQEAPKTFGLDNVDGTLNPGLVRELTKVMVEACAGRHSEGSANAYQAFMTSHHPSSLDSFDIFRDDQRIFVASRRKEGVAVGSTSLERLEPPQGVDRDKWVEITEGRKLSVFLLEEKIPGALT